MKSLTRIAVLVALAFGATFGTATMASADTVCHAVADINAPSGERQVCEEHNGESHEETINRQNGGGGTTNGGSATTPPATKTQPKTTKKTQTGGSGQQSGQSATTTNGGKTKVITAQPDGTVTVEVMGIESYVAMRGQSRVGENAT